jgi:hypothetical protein
MPRRPRTRLMPGISVLVERNRGPLRQILADGTPRGRTLNQWVKSSLAQRSACAACTNATGLYCDGAQRQRSGQRQAGHGTTARGAPGIALDSTPKRLPGASVITAVPRRARRQEAAKHYAWATCPGLQASSRPYHPCVPCPEVAGSDPDLRGNRISHGMAAAAASRLSCRAWVLLTCGSPLADGLVTGHDLSFEVADFRERAPPGPVCGRVG